MRFLRDRNFLRLYKLQVLYAFAVSFGTGFAFFYYVSEGFTYTQLMIYETVAYSSILLGVVFMGFYGGRAYAYIKAGVAALILLYVLLYTLSSEIQLYAIAGVWAFMIPFFWIPFNTLYYRLRRKDNIASMSGVSFMVFPVIGAFLPFFSGILINNFGLRFIFAVGALVSLIPLYYVLKTQSDVSLAFNVPAALERMKKLQAIVLLEGVWQGVDWLSVPLFTLYFIKDGLAWGTFLSYLGVVGVIAALILCRMSDRRRKSRLKYVLPAVTLTGVFTIMSGFAPTLGYWLILRGIVGFLVGVTSPFTMSVLVDKSKSIKDTMIVRELLLNIGRLLGVLIVSAVYLSTGSVQYPLIISGTLFLAYPLLIVKNKVYPGRISIRSLILDDILEFIQS